MVSNVEDPPPWKETQLDFIDDFLHFFKPSTSDNVFQQHFYDHRQHYSDYVPIYTDGSKSDNHVGSAAVFPDFSSLRHFALSAPFTHLNSMQSTWGF
ncbi:hypothetical protein AVEN_116895-1 [Araneus ventricosus]|uniref:Uncharacterized protein n=1 Tax=Araneus ventricosus TaxID=182803 RepID=A0A4Y2KN42_ARAVE|nr:hypothetical protein AVEN_144990-1 [Araneus ventricosus]GBN03801.1 hypothetical protein AVEN_116895-1 [Araneus ventricosus]